MKKKTKTLILSVVITLVLLLTFTVSYALFAYQETGLENNQLIMGDIWMSFNESNGIDLSGAMPGDDYSEYFEFNIKGRNTYTERDIYYEILLSRGETPDDKEETNRIPDEYLNFKLVEVLEDDSETIIFTDKSYSNIANKRIHIETIPRNQTEEYNKTYRLYMVINDKLTLGNTDNAVMTTEDYQKAFASVKVNVLGDFEEKELPKNFVSLIKSKPAEDGLVAINTDGELYDGTGEIREYRYSGIDVNNYVFFDTNNDGVKTDDEIWRIVGVFKDPIKDSDGEIVLDANGDITYEEKIKLVKNASLLNTILPFDYVINNTKYTIRSNASENYHSAYWNLGPADDSDWTTAGLQYYLNTEHDESTTPVNGYLSFINPKSRSLISPTTYYLGNYVYGTTPLESYQNERDETNILDKNKPSLTSLVGLLYPSDLGYSASSEEWNITLNEVHTSSWFDTLIIDYYSYWYLSPSMGSDYYVYKYVTYSETANSNVAREYPSHDGSYFFDAHVVPVIHLVPDVTIIDAPGTLEEPYVVVID